MQRLEVSGVVRPIYGSLGVKRLTILKHTAHGLLKSPAVTLYTIRLKIKKVNILPTECITEFF